MIFYLIIYLLLLSFKMSNNFASVVIDNGTGYTKMGYAGNMEPSYLIPTVIADAINKGTTKQASQNSNFSNPELDFHIGDDAFLH